MDGKRHRPDNPFACLLRALWPEMPVALPWHGPCQSRPIFTGPGREPFRDETEISNLKAAKAYFGTHNLRFGEIA